jgi:3-deoxy-manno-octulosonate cytidylyltransferase (CMP-KDO synthetase)
VESSRQRIVGVIPARYASTRFPGKVLAMLGDRTVLQHVHERALACTEIDRVIVATDDDRVLREVLAFGGVAVLTSDRHRSGTDRVAEAVEASASDCELVVNIQGDEPFLDPGAVDALARALRARPDAIWTAVAPLADPEASTRPSVVKAVVTADGRVLYFSRAPVPYLRDESCANLRRHHVGIYGFSREVLRKFVGMPPSALETAEGLEQLRALEGGLPIRAVTVAQAFGGIDTQEDLERALRRLAGAERKGNG